MGKLGVWSIAVTSQINSWESKIEGRIEEKEEEEEVVLSP